MDKTIPVEEKDRFGDISKTKFPVFLLYFLEFVKQIYPKVLINCFLIPVRGDYYYC